VASVLVGLFQALALSSAELPVGQRPQVVVRGRPVALAGLGKVIRLQLTVRAAEVYVAGS